MTRQAEIYLVGGAVRDRLLGLPVTDKDWLVVHATPDDLLKQGYLQVGKDFPVFLHPDTKEEYALARTERKNGKGYTGFCCDFSPEITLEQDLMRRDLTINAMAEDLQGNLHDPYHGIADLQQKKLRHISAAFCEDPLRVLRVARFAARFHPLGFTIADETLAIMKKMVNQGELQTLTTERIWLETEKALSCAFPQIYFHVLAQVGAISLFKELQPLYRQANPRLSETLAVLNSCISEMPLLIQKSLRFACFFVCLSLLPTANTNRQTLQQLRQFCQRYKVASVYLELALSAVRFTAEFSQTHGLTPEKIVTVFDQLDCWRKPQRLIQLCFIYRAVFTDFHVSEQQQWLHWYQQAKAVDVQQIIADGFHRQQIKDELYRRRILAISQ